MSTLWQPALADKVGLQAEAIYFLKAVQGDYLRQANISSEKIRAFAEHRARSEGIAANCRGVTSQQLPDEAELARETLSKEIGALVMLLADFSSDHVVAPTSGMYRNEFLAGYGQGCSPMTKPNTTQIDSAFEAIQGVVLIEREIQTRRDEIIRKLAEQTD